MILSLMSCDKPDNDSSVPDKDTTQEQGPGQEQEPGPVIEIKDALSGSLKVSLAFSGSAYPNSGFSIFLPYPSNDQYQQITDISTDGEVLDFEDAGSYVAWYGEYDNEEKIDSSFSVTFRYRTYSVEVDFSVIEEIHPYDTTSAIWKNYTGKSGKYIDPENRDIIKAADRMWDQSEDIVDYARRCYEYVASRFQYLNPNTGIHTLEDNIRNGGGDCGNLSAIFISLLRNKEIPARTVNCIRPEGSFHVWSEFYLEGYGWIPVDVTYKNADPSGDYFGTYPGDCIVVSYDLDKTLLAGDHEYDLALLQTYAYWYRNMSDVNVNYRISRR